MRRGQGGVALVLVLWVVTLLAVIAGNFAFSMRSEALIARNLISTAQAKALADAGVQRAWFELLKPTSDSLRWQANGVEHIFEVGGAQLRVSIHDESGKIDLNTASDELLKGLLVSVGLSEPAGSALLDKILDWRDADRLKRLHGAEEDDYRAAGKNYVPTNAPFEVVNELQRVLEITPELYRKLAPALTVYSGQLGIKTAVAPRQVLLAIPRVNSDMVDQYLLQRQSLLATNQKATDFAGAGLFGSAVEAPPAYLVRSEVKAADGTRFVQQAVARLTQDPKRPLTVLAWGEGEHE